MKIISLFLLFMTLHFVISNKTFAAEDMPVDPEALKSDLMLVIGGGLGGAILGLSTLSFVDEPKDHTRNIMVGASIGVIVGVAVVAFSQATKSRDLLYDAPAEEGDYEASYSTSVFGTRDRLVWHNEEVAHFSSLSESLNQVSYSLRF